MQCFVMMRFMHTVYVCETRKQTVAIKEDGSNGLSVVVVNEQRVCADGSLSDISPINSVVYVIIDDGDGSQWP